MTLGAPPPGHAHPSAHVVVPFTEPGGHQIPAAQDAHVALDVAPVAAEKVPERQGPFSRPPPPQNWPAGHVTVLVVLPSGQKNPAVQNKHVARDVADVAAEYVPTGHRVHAVLPVVSAYVPAAQPVHTLVDAPVMVDAVPTGQPTGAAPPPGQ